MADEILSVQLKGLKEVDERLVQLGAVAGEKVMRTALFQASKPILQQAVANVTAIPRGSGALAKSLRRVYLRAGSQSSRTSKPAGQNRFVMAIAPKAKDRVATALANLHYKKRRPIKGVFWGHLVEWGFTHRGGKRVLGRLVFTRAITARATDAVEIFRRQIDIAIDKALKKK